MSFHNNNKQMDVLNKTKPIFGVSVSHNEQMDDVYILV